MVDGRIGDEEHPVLEEEEERSRRSFDPLARFVDLECGSNCLWVGHGETGDEAVGITSVNHHVAEVDRVSHRFVGGFQGDPLAPAGAGEDLGVHLGFVAGQWVDDLDGVFWHLVLVKELVDFFGRTEQHGSADALVGQDLGRAYDLDRLALGEDDSLGIGRRLVEDAVHDPPGTG